jgi:hypothetical protein
MEVLIWVILVVLLYLFFFWKPGSQFDMVPDKKQGIPPNVIQAVIEAIQKDKPNEVPLETLFINVVGPDTYSCRFMFLNSQGYYGTQYDVKAVVTPEGSVNIQNISTSSKVDNYDSGFTPYKPDRYVDYTDIQKATDNKFQNELSKFREAQLNPGSSNDFSTQKLSSMYGQNIQANADMQKFLSSQTQTSFTNSASPDSSIPGPSPARSGDIVAPGAPVFNSA